MVILSYLYVNMGSKLMQVDGRGATVCQSVAKDGQAVWNDRRDHVSLPTHQWQFSSKSF